MVERSRFANGGTMMLCGQNASNKKHRVIGIRHVLKRFKNEGFVDGDVMYANEAVANVKDEMLGIAQRWYQIGARRGGREILKAFIKGNLRTQRTIPAKLKIIAYTNQIPWRRSLNVRVGHKKIRIPKREYTLTTKDLGFNSGRSLT